MAATCSRTLPDGEEEEEEEDAMLAEKDGVELSFILHSRPGRQQRPPPLVDAARRLLGFPHCRPCQCLAATAHVAPMLSRRSRMTPCWRRPTAGRRSESTPLFLFPLFPIPGILHLLSFSLALFSVVDRVGKIANVVDGGVPGRGSQWVGVLLNGEMDDAVVGKTK